MTTETKIPEYEGWAVVELMGHRRLAGYVREASMFGTALLRLDVPGEDPEKARATQYYGGGSIYAITPCTEEIARSLSKHARETPEAIAYALPEPRRCDAFWKFHSSCSTDFGPDPDDRNAILCGRHLLQREAEAEGDAGDAHAEQPVGDAHYGTPPPVKVVDEPPVTPRELELQAKSARTPEEERELETLIADRIPW